MESAKADQCSWCHRPFTSTTSEGTETSAPATKSGNRPSISLRQQPLVDPEPEEEDAQIAIGSAPRATSQESVPPIVAQETAEPTPRQIIGLKRPGGKPTPPQSSPSGGVPVSEQTNPSPKPASNQTSRLPAPGVIGMKRPPAPGAPLNRPSAPNVAPPQTPTAPTTSNRPTLPQAKLDVSQSKTASAQGAPQTSRPAVPLTLLQGAAPKSGVRLAPEEEEEAGGLASGNSAPRGMSTSSSGANGSGGSAAAAVHAPQLGTFNAQKSKYYADQVIDTVSGTHYDAASGRPTNVRKGPEPDVILNWDDAPSEPTTSKITRFILVYAAILATVGVFTFAFKPTAIALMCLGLFSAGLLAPVMRAVPWQRDDSDDVIWYALFTVIFGPAIGLIIYGVMGLMKQGVNMAMVGCFLITLTMHIIIYLALSPIYLIQFVPPLLQPGGTLHLNLLLVNAGTGLLTLAGWYFANFFHKLDE